MSSPQTIEPSGRRAPCAAGCRHASCRALAKPSVDALAARVRVALHLAGADADAVAALDRLACLARGDAR